MNDVITITDAAKVKILELKSADGFDEFYLRISAVGGGCSGLSYKLEFTNTISNGEKVYESNDVRVLVDAKSLLYLIDMTVDYSDGLNGKGFTFTNPNAIRTCGCGESFSV